MRLATGRLARCSALPAALVGPGATAHLTRARLEGLLDGGSAPDAGATLAALLEGLAPETPGVPEVGRRAASGVANDSVAPQRPPGRARVGDRRPPQQNRGFSHPPATRMTRTAQGTSEQDASPQVASAQVASAPHGGPAARHLAPRAAPAGTPVASRDRPQLSAAAACGAATPIGRPQPGSTIVTATAVTASEADRPRARSGGRAAGTLAANGAAGTGLRTDAQYPQSPAQAPTRDARPDSAGLARAQTSKAAYRPAGDTPSNPAVGSHGGGPERPLATTGGGGLADLVAWFDAQPPAAGRASSAAEEPPPACVNRTSELPPLPREPFAVASDDRTGARDAIRDALEEVLLEEARACGVEVRP